ncbi:hypothetical protein VP01_2013g4 [Puccinia sorghi]|uniref:Uncharacterized protein n=1 Tax=Puccinia sorghi TaxID=27349 RepID=A0A0L6VB99_9BASI|nr:hypothetical protein VP01_2013g4 [Puccinia sorghi]
MDGISSDGTAAPSVKQSLPQKKKSVATVGPIGWTNDLTHTKVKKTKRASMPQLPLSSVVTPPTPSQPPPKKRKKNSDTPQQKTTEMVWPSLDSFANLTPEEILARFAKPVSSNPTPRSQPRAGKRVKVDKPDAPQSPPEPVLPIPSPSQQAPGPTIPNPQDENSDNAKQVQSSQAFPNPQDENSNNAKQVQSSQACSLNNAANPPTQPLVPNPAQSFAADSSVPPSLEESNTTSTPHSRPLTKPVQLPTVAPECSDSPLDNQPQSQLLNNVVKEGSQISAAKRKKRKSTKPPTEHVDQSNVVLEATSMPPSNPPTVPTVANVQPSKPSEALANASSTAPIPFNGQNLHHTSTIQAEGTSASASRPAHQPVSSHATEAVPAQDKINGSNTDNPADIVDNEQQPLNIPEKPNLLAIRKEKSKAKAKQKKQQKKRSLRSVSVSTAHTTQEARCFSSVSASPYPKELDFHMPSRQSTPVSMLNIPKHFGRWELSIPSDREVPAAVLARMHHFLDEAVCAGFAKPIFRDLTPAISERPSLCIPSPKKDLASAANPPTHLTKLPTIQSPTPVPDESNTTSPATIPKIPSPPKTNHLANEQLLSSMTSAPQDSVPAAHPSRYTIELPMTQPSTPMTDDNRLTNPEPTPKPPSPSQATNLVTTEMIPHGRSLKRTLSTCSSSLSDDINNTVMMTLGLEEDSCQYDFEPNPNKQKVHKDPQTASNQKLIDATRDQSQKHVSVPTSEVSTASSSNRSDEVPSNKLSAPSLPPPEHQSSTPPTSCHSKTESVSKSDSSEDESDSSEEESAPPSAQRPRKTARPESSSSDDESSSASSSHDISPAQPPLSQSSAIPTSQYGIAGLYGKGPVDRRRLTLDAFRPLDFSLDPPTTIDNTPVLVDSIKHAGQLENDSSSTSDEDESESESSGSDHNRPKKQTAYRALGLPAHKLAGSAAPRPSAANTNPNQSQKKRTKTKTPIAQLFRKEEAKIIRSKKKS